jgi:hypothetical protein
MQLEQYGNSQDFVVVPEVFVDDLVFETFVNVCGVPPQQLHKTGKINLSPETSTRMDYKERLSEHVYGLTGVTIHPLQHGTSLVFNGHTKAVQQTLMPLDDLTESKAYDARAEGEKKRSVSLKRGRL